jgi:O-acetyl-ADP-ribose deacetylase (regulator of RNase III)
MVSGMIGNTRLMVLSGDITGQDTQAIVNAANARLAGGGGVDGAIHAAGGPDIMRECRAIGGCPTGEAVITTGGKLKARKVIHTVGPIYRLGQDNAALLAGCYSNSLKLAAEHSLRTISFPSISTGAYGYPLAEASLVALTETIRVVKEMPDCFDQIRFVMFGELAYKVFEEVFLETIQP